MKIDRIMVGVLLVMLALIFLPLMAQAQAKPADTIATIDNALTSTITDEQVREFARCELQAGVWGGYAIGVQVGKGYTKDRVARIFQIAKGKFTEKPEPESKVDTAKTTNKGEVHFATKEEAFARGVPFFISDPVLVTPTELKYTVHSNPAISHDKAFFMMEFRNQYMSGSALEVLKPFKSQAEPQTRTHKMIHPVDTKDKNRFEIVTAMKNEYQGCLASNTVDLNALAEVQPPK